MSGHHPTVGKSGGNSLSFLSEFSSIHGTRCLANPSKCDSYSGLLVVSRVCSGIVHMVIYSWACYHRPLPPNLQIFLMLLSSLSTSQYFYFIVGLLNLYDSPLKVFRSHLNVLICLSCVLIPSSTFSFVTLAYFKGADLVLWRFSVVLWRQVSLYVLCCCAGFGVCTFAPCVKWGWGVLWSTHWVYSVIFPAELLCLPWFLLWILLWFVGWAQIFPLRISLWDNPSFHVLLNSVTLLLSFTFHLPKHIDFYMFLCSICSICPFPLSLLFIVCHPGMLSLHSCLSRAFILPAAWGCRVLLFHWCFLDSHVYRVGSEEPGYGSETLHF